MLIRPAIVCLFSRHILELEVTYNQNMAAVNYSGKYLRGSGYQPLSKLLLLYYFIIIKDYQPLSKKLSVGSSTIHCVILSFQSLSGS